MTHISSRQYDEAHPDTTLSKQSTTLTKILTTKTRQDGNYLLPITTLQLTLHKRTPTSLFQYVVSGSSDGGCILSIIIGIIPDKRSVETSYKSSDTYGQIYSTMTRILIYPTQDGIQSCHHHIEAEYCASAAATTTTTAFEPAIP